MTADTFIIALREAAAGYRPPATDGPAARERAAAAAAWAGVKRRRTPAFTPADPDPVLDLLARYDLSGVRIHQFEFAPEPFEYGRGLLRVAKQCMHDYYVCYGTVHVMYYKECEPNDTGLESAVFLDLLALRARMIAEGPLPPTSDAFDRIAAVYAREALALSTLAGRLNFFGEERASFEAGKRRPTDGRR